MSRRQSKPRYQGTTHELAGWAISHLLSTFEVAEQPPTGEVLENLVALLNVYHEGTKESGAEKRLFEVEDSMRKLNTKVSMMTMGGKK